MKPSTKKFLINQIRFIILGLITLIPFNILFMFLLDSGINNYFEVIWFSIIESVLINIWYNLAVYFDKHDQLW